MPYDMKKSGDQRLATGIALAGMVLGLIATYLSMVVLLDGDYVAALIVPAAGVVLMVGFWAIAHKMGLPIIENIKSLYARQSRPQSRENE